MHSSYHMSLSGFRDGELWFLEVRAVLRVRLLSLTSRVREALGPTPGSQQASLGLVYTLSLKTSVVPLWGRRPRFTGPDRDQITPGFRGTPVA